MQRKMAIANATVFILVMAGFFFLLTAFPPDTRSVERENRELNTMPPVSAKTIFNGEFTSGFEDYLSDKAGFRSDLISAGHAFENNWQGFTTSSGAQIIMRPGADDDREEVVTLPPATPAPTPESAPSPDPETAATASSAAAPPSASAEKPSIALEAGADGIYEPHDVAPPIKAGSMLKFDGKLMEIYGFSAATIDKYTAAVNAYRSALPESTRVFCAVMPTQIEFIDDKYHSVTDSERKGLDYIKDQLDPGVTFVDAYYALKSHKDEYIFFRTDHHWTALGAYYAYTVFAVNAGFTPLSLTEDYDAHSAKGFLGYLYNSSPSEEIKKNPDTIVYYTLKEPPEMSQKVIYPPKEGKTPTYGIFMGGDWDRYEVHTSVGNGKTIFILKDSYANAFIPFLAPHYENIVVIDPRHYKGSVLEDMKQYDDADLLFFDYILAAGMSGYINALAAVK